MNDTAIRVLIADDQELVRMGFRLILDAQPGIKVVAEVADGEAALAAMRARRADLVVLDLMLPGIDGLEVCRRLRESGEVPVIMLTALGAETDRIMGLGLGADDYVTKPFSPRELVLRVESVLRRTSGRAPELADVFADGDLMIDQVDLVAEVEAV